MKLEEFLANIAPPDSRGCRAWLRATDPRGYGLVQLNGKFQRASRAMYQHTFGPIPDGMIVCHRCDNPPCLEPSHLFLGTFADNNRDRSQKGRSNPLRGEKAPLAKLSDGQVREIRLRRGRGEELKPLAAEFGVSFQLIWQVCNGLGWKHVS